FLGWRVTKNASNCSPLLAAGLVLRVLHFRDLNHRWTLMDTDSQQEAERAESSTAKVQSRKGENGLWISEKRLKPFGGNVNAKAPRSKDARIFSLVRI